MSAPSYGDSDNVLLRKIAEGVAGSAVPSGETPQIVSNLDNDPALAAPSSSKYPSTLATYEFVTDLTINHETLPYSATTNIDFAGVPYRTLTLTGDVTFTTSNRVAARTVSILIKAGASSRNLTFPGGWIFVGGAPTSLAANKEAILTVTCFGTAESDVRAAYSAQA